MQFANLKYGIITINDNTNYGNRLQNFALYQLLSRYGNSTTVHMLRSSNISFVNHIKHQLFLIKHISKFIDRCLFRLFLSLSRKKKLERLRLCANKSFTDHFVPDNSFWLSSRFGLRTFSNSAISLYIIGSDQVWNYRWLSKEDLALRLGSFVSDNIPVVSYAASFGVSEVPEDVKPIFQKYLPRLKAISVREDRGAELIREMTGLDAEVVLDPTLMLDTDQWNKITRGFVSNDNKYVLTYFLGEPSDMQEKIIQEYAQKHGCCVRRILDLRDEETYVAGPQDFVELFSKAQYVFTDSYHACCFSILYHKQFTVFNRAGMEGKANMNSRMETLFRLFDLDSVVMDKGLAPRIDYDKVDKLLAQHRTESQAWLDKAMEV